MFYQRRDFLKAASILGSGLLFTSFNKVTAYPLTASSKKTAAIDAFGLQLYTLREVLPDDPQGILKQLATFGYKQIEGYEGPKGIFWGMKNTEFKGFLDSIGLHYISTHCNINENFEQKADEAAAIGLKYLICPSYAGERENNNLDFFKKAAERFNQLGEVCRQRGMRFAYHNHEATFKPVEGQFPQDVLMTNTDPALVDYEMDIYWVSFAGQDPISWFQKYPNRFRLSHVKDRRKDVPATERNGFTVLGTGGVDIPKILKAGQQNGLQYFIVEQDRTNDVLPLTAVQQNAEYMKKLKL